MHVLLFANVWGRSSDFYHVGDEAMFYEMFRAYTRHRPDVRCTVLSGMPPPAYTNVEFYDHISWPQKHWHAISYFLRMVFKLLIYYFFKKNFFTQSQFSLVQVVARNQRVHFTGGGNLSSLFPGWLFYSYFLIFMSWLLGKEVRLSSQTIGPLWGIDRLFSVFILNLPQEITIREPIDRGNPLLSYGCVVPKVKGVVDAAYVLPMQSSYSVPPKKANIRIGISVHEWRTYSAAITKIVVSIVTQLHAQYGVEVLLIPHILTSDTTGWDKVYMNQIASQFPPTVRKIVPTYRQLMRSAAEPACTIKYLTAQVDLLITSRYHGVVFALATNTPCLSFVMEKYYRQKNQRAFAVTYGKHPIQQYLLDLDQKTSGDAYVLQAKQIVRNLKQEKLLLKQANMRLKQNGLLDSKTWVS